MKLRNQLLWGAALALSMGCSTTLNQPCTVGRAEGGSYLATATRTSTDTCDDTNNDGINAGPGDDFAVANKAWNIDFNHFTFRVEKFGTKATEFGRSVAIIPRYFLHTSGTLVNEPYGTTAVAVGDLTSDFTTKDAAANNLGTCTVPTLSPAVANVYGAPETFKFSNVKFLTEPGYQGAEVAFDLEYTDLGGCPSTYKVIALQPAAGCSEDKNCHWNTIADDPTCNDVTGMLSNIPVHCNTDIGFCEVTGTDFPVTGPGIECAAAAAP